MTTDATLAAKLGGIGSNGRVTADDVLNLRRDVFADGIVSPAELDALFDLAGRAPEGAPEWEQFFGEAVADFYLREEEPQGYLTEEEFRSLEARLMRDRAVSRLEINLLVKLLEDARQTPQAFTPYVGEQIKQSILNKPGGPQVDDRDAALLRRFLFAAGGDGNVAVTRMEAEILFDINDAAEKARNSPAWTELFVQGVINHLMAHLGYSAPSREEAFRRNAWARDRSTNVGGFFKRMLSGGFAAIQNAYSEESVYTEHSKAQARDAAEAEKITPQEAEWLAKRIGRDGGFDANERRLISRMQEFESELPAALKSLVENAA